jgi:hypothetical protein
MASTVVSNWKYRGIGSSRVAASERGMGKAMRTHLRSGRARHLEVIFCIVLPALTAWLADLNELPDVPNRDLVLKVCQS